MRLLRFFAAASLAALLGAAALPTVYTAPAGFRVAGSPDPAVPFDAVLPNGRIVAPTGKSAVVGMRARGVALAPGGKYVIVASAGIASQGRARFGKAVAAPSLAVLNARTMGLTDVYRLPGSSFSSGLTAVEDPGQPARTLVIASDASQNVLRFFRLTASGMLTPTGTLSVRSPSALGVSANHQTLYVVQRDANAVTAIDLRTRTLRSTVPVGYKPFDVAVSGRRLYVTDPGLMAFSRLTQPVRLPEFANVPPAPDLASALSTLPLDASGNPLDGILSTPMDRAPDGVDNVGGARPEALTLSKNGRYAYVCMANVDRVAIVDVAGTPHVVAGLQLRLFDKAPYGTNPDGIVRSPDGQQVYVLLGGMNAVAVLDGRNPARLHRLGLIPSGARPRAITVSGTGRYLYVLNEDGFGQRWSTLQRIDLHRLPLRQTTLSALRYARLPRRPIANRLISPLRSLQRSDVISHVVFIVEEGKTFDSMLGDLTDAQGRSYGGGDPRYTWFGQSITPNLHALARQFALATNYYVDRDMPSLAGRPNDPDTYPRAGYLFNDAQRAGLSYRDYGGFVRLAGYDDGMAPNPLTDDPQFLGPNDRSAPTSGLGGLYTLDVPALAALGDYIDVNYPGWNLRIRDTRRADEFVKDYTALEQRNAVPDYTFIWLPDDHGGTGPDIPPLDEEVADGDQALGHIVDFLSHQPTWRSTAIFVTADGTGSSIDHVDPFRSYAIVVSPYSKRHYTSSLHLSTASIAKTQEELLGLPPVTLNDLLAGDMTNFFTPVPNLTPFQAISRPF